MGYCPQFERTYPLRAGDIEFARIDAKEFFFGHAATVLVVQGMVPQDFFAPDVYFKSTIDGYVLERGPFIFLKGELSRLTDPPLRLKNMVLARVFSVPEGTTRTELLGSLLKAVL